MLSFGMSMELGFSGLVLTESAGLLLLELGACGGCGFSRGAVANDGRSGSVLGSM